MSTLYITQPGARLEKDHGRIVATKDDQTLIVVPLTHIDHIVLVGNVGVTTPALHALLDGGVGLSLLDRWGRPRGQLEPATGKNIRLRQQQYTRAQDPGFCLAISRAIAGGKLRNYRTLARRIARSRPVDASLLQRLDSAVVAAAGAADLAALRGMEGEGSRCYFAVLRGALRAELDFANRTRRPPGDPVNALMSLGYTLLAQNLMAACQVVGLDSYAGFYHSDKYGRPALALDLIEEFRSVVVDSVVLNLVNRCRIGIDDFEPGPEGGVFLKRPALRLYFTAYSARINTTITYAPAGGRPLTYQKLFEVQARRLRHCIEDNTGDYTSYLTR